MYLGLEEVMSIECREKISLHYHVYGTSTSVSTLLMATSANVSFK